jgi:8-oxo-dGTP pyrophosphatase MutT (NUDIX family)
MIEDLAKAHVKGHMRGEHYVRPYERGEGSAPLEPHDHPEANDKGQPVLIKQPSHPSAPSTWDDPDAVATFVPGGDCPARLNGVSLTRWRDHPDTADGWDYVDGVNDDLVEPPMVAKPGKSIGAGVIIEEPDGRVWLCAPTNRFGGYDATYPKGTAEPGLSLQANAIKEAFEETGLKVEITGFVGDFERTTSVARMYRARRVGGTPVAMGWESQAVHLCPKSHLYDLLNGWADHPVAEALGAGPAPKKPAPPQGKWSGSKPLF